jgi:hypothetical protein
MMQFVYNIPMKYARTISTILVSFYFLYYARTYTEWHFIDSVNLIFHEAGHTLFIFFGQFIRVLMGSGFQVVLPLLISVYFFYQRQKISAAICLMWTGQNVLNVSVYARDALYMQLNLLGGDASIHDWNYLLQSLNLLRYSNQVANSLYALGMLTIVGAIAYGLYISYTMDRTRQSEL